VTVGTLTPLRLPVRSGFEGLQHSSPAVRTEAMTHFLFLEKGAQARDAGRTPREKSAMSARSRRRAEAAAEAPAFVFLVVPQAGGYRVLRAALEDVGEISAAEAGRRDLDGSAILLESLLASPQGSALLGRLEPPGRSSENARTGRAAHERFGDVEIDVPARVVTSNGDVVALAPMEFDLLLALVRRNGAAASRRDLLREVWGTTKAVSLRTVDTHIANLRRKLEDDPAHPHHILTVKKVGYRLKR
jgi:two-component system, OmpR family, alkaline phosphatase synthesis response regulator PhoP